MSLPIDAEVVADSRDYAILDFLILPNCPEGHDDIWSRVAVLWDADRDQRVLHVLSALRYRTHEQNVPLADRGLNSFGRIRAVAESKATLTVWLDASPLYAASTYSVAERLADSTADIAAAVASAIPADHWTLDVRSVEIEADGKGTVSYNKLPPNDRLRAVAPSYRLGLHGGP